MEKLASQIIAEILVQEMDLDDQSVWIDDVNYNIPNSEGLLIAIGVPDSQILSSTKTLRFDGEDVYEVMHLNIRENVNLDVMSRGIEALTRRWEVVTALNSTRSKQAQEANSFKICKIPNAFLNTSSPEGGSQLARYTLSFACLVWYKKEQLLTRDGGYYFDTFGNRVDDAQSIGTETGIIEFTLDEETEI